MCIINTNNHEQTAGRKRKNPKTRTLRAPGAPCAPRAPRAPRAPCAPCARSYAELTPTITSKPRRANLKTRKRKRCALRVLRMPEAMQN